MDSHLLRINNTATNTIDVTSIPNNIPRITATTTDIKNINQI